MESMRQLREELKQHKSELLLDPSFLDTSSIRSR